MREVSASPVMAHYLSFAGNTAFAEGGKHPDENYAREVMQLFTIGLHELNMDGTASTHQSHPPPFYNAKNVAARFILHVFEGPADGDGNT